MIPFNLKISSKSHPQDQAKMCHWDSECWKKINGPSPASFLFIYVFFTNEQYHFYNKSMWKNVHPVYDTGIRTNDFP